MTDIADVDNVDVDDDDTTGQDRGDVLVDDAGAKPDAARGPDGKFVAKEGGSTEEEEEEEEQEEEGEEQGEEEEEEEDDKKTPNAGVRLDKMRAQRDAARLAQQQLEARIAALEGKAAPKDEPKADPVDAIKAEINDLYEKIEEARLDGDAKLAAQLQRQQDEQKEALLDLKAERIASKTTTEASENARYDSLLDKLEADIPVLDARHDDFDPQAVKALEFYVEAHEKMGMSASRALAAAARVVFDYGKAAPAKAEEPAAKADSKVVELKRKADVTKAIGTAAKQPPDTAGRGVDRDDTTLDPDAISDEDWDKLPASKRKQMRGDFG